MDGVFTVSLANVVKCEVILVAGQRTYLLVYLKRQSHNVFFAWSVLSTNTEKPDCFGTIRRAD